MQKLTRRGLASFGVAALLVLAPITATAAYADDEVIVAEAPAEVVAEAPAEVVAEAPAETVAVEEPIETTVLEEELATEPPSADAEVAVVDGEAERVSAELPGSAPSATRAATVPIYTQMGNSPIYLSIDGLTLTISWDPTAAGPTTGYYSQLYDFNTGRVLQMGDAHATSFTAVLIPGHRYQPYFHDNNGQPGYKQGYTNFVFVPPAPNAPTDVTATRLPSADGFSLSWAAPVENTENPATSYSIDVTSNRNTTNYTTTDLSYDFTELSVGDSYTFAVTGVADDEQVSEVATTDATLEAIAPTVPLSLSLTRTGGQITASWGAPSYNGGAEVGSYDIALRSNGILIESYTATAAGSLVLDEPAGYETEYTVDVTATNDAELTSTATTSNSVVRPAVTPTTPAVTAERLPTSSAYTVAWTESTAGDSPITGYIVRLYNTDDDSLISSVTVSPTTRSTTLAIPSTITSGSGLRFEVVAAAENVLSSVTGYDYDTFVAVAPSAVRGLELIRVGDDLVASWDAPAYDGGFGITRYDVVLYADGAIQSQDATDGNTSLVMADAAKYSIKYTVEVTAVGDGYIPGPSSESNVIERANFAPTTPTSFGSAYGYKEPMINASWDFAPQEGSRVESVTVTLYNADGSIAQQEELTVLDGRTSTNLSGLTNDTTYSIGVVATNAAGSSTESARAEVRTNALVPPAATQEEVVALPNYNNVTASLTGTELTAHIDGVTAGEWVFGYAYSTPSALGWTQVDANGFARWTISGAGLATGATHTLAVQNNFGAQLGFATFAIAADASTAALAHTGSEADTVLLLAAAMLALGAVLMVRRRVRV